MAETVERTIPVEYDERGRPLWRSVMTPPDNSIGVCHMVPDRVIPVIFVPGIMGSNLIEKGAESKRAIKWRMDDSGSAAKWWWAWRGATFRKNYLRPEVMEVDTGGRVPDAVGRLRSEELRRRGWGEVGALSYEPLLTWLEQALSDYETCQTGERDALRQRPLDAELGEAPLTRAEVGLSYRYRFPVHACGYNWLDDNATSAKRLSARIDEIRARYARDKMNCDKVILVTHSMGGLVARHCSEVADRRDDILGIVHGVMPAIGAAAVYRRFKSGTETPKRSWLHPGDKIVNGVTASVLGNDGGEMTAVLSSAPGALQLLPTAEYGNGWLKVKDGATTFALPNNGDPYGQIYTVRGKWWSMCEDLRIDPRRKPNENRDADWAGYKKLIEDRVKPFHEAISQKYHPHTHAFYGSHTDHRAYGTVSWTSRHPMPAMPMQPGPAMSRYTPESRNVLAGTGLGAGSRETGTTRTAAVPVSGGWRKIETHSYEISTPDEPGDGTVPHRSGIAPKPYCQSLLRVNVEHEPAYKHAEGLDNERACRFTLRAIVKIAQRVKETALRYEE